MHLQEIDTLKKKLVESQLELRSELKKTDAADKQVQFHLVCCLFVIKYANIDEM